MNKEIILQNVQALKPKIQVASREIESGNTLPRWLVDDLKSAGCFRLCMPKNLGGPELNTLEQLEMIEALAMLNASVAWCVMIGSDSGIFSGFLEEEAALKLYSSLDTIQAGAIYPGGRAIDTGDGYMVTGHWTFGSGIMHADVIAAGCLVYENEKLKLNSQGKPEWIVVVGTQAKFEIENNWDTTGLHGTGSHNYHVTNGFFTRAHSFSLLKPARREGILWRRNDTFLRKMPGVPLGGCRAALDFTHQYLSEKLDNTSRKPLKLLSAVQRRLAECEMRYNACRAYVYDSLSKQWECLVKNELMSEQLRANVWLSRINAFRTSREVIFDLYDLIGGHAIRKWETPVEQAMRDAMTWCQHVAAKETGIEAAGNLLLNNAISDGFPLI